MKCDYLRLINKYADGELYREDKDFMDNHIPFCPECKDELRLTVFLKKSSLVSKVKTNPDFFWEQLKTRISREPDPKEGFIIDFAKWSKRLIPVPVAIGLIAAILLSNPIVSKENLIDRYLFGNHNGNVSALVDGYAQDNSGLESLFY
jgi:hypothetical protein